MRQTVRGSRGCSTRCLDGDEAAVGRTPRSRQSPAGVGTCDVRADLEHDGSGRALVGPRQFQELAYDDGLIQAEIATRLGVFLGTVKTWVWQGLEQLQDM